MHVRQRFLPPVSVFHATECQFNDDFSELALKITSTFGMTGWVSTSFHETLVVVEDPRASEWRHPVYVQNVAAKTGKLQGELPVRSGPSLQAPKVGTLTSFRIVEAVERKLVKDQVWLRIRHWSSPETPAASASRARDSDNDNDTLDRVDDATTATPRRSDSSHSPVEPTAWVIERNVNTGERVVVPWGADGFRPEQGPRSDCDERYYRNVYSRRPLPLRRRPELSADIVGQVDPGVVFASTERVLNAHGRMWVRVPLMSPANDTIANHVEDTNQPEFGYAIQSNAKTNRCMLQEIPSPTKMAPPQVFRVTTARLAAYAAPSAASKALFDVRDGALLQALGTLFVATERRVWLQVLAADIDRAMRVPLPNVVLSVDEQQQNVVYVPVCALSRPTDAVVRRLHVRQLTHDPSSSLSSLSSLSANDTEAKPTARVVFTGRASKLFGSQLIQPSTLDLPTLKPTPKQKHKETTRSPVAPAAGETQATAAHARLKDEITRWQRESERLSAVSAFIGRSVAQLTECVTRPWTACRATAVARQQYAQLYEQDEDEDDLEFGELRV